MTRRKIRRERLAAEAAAAQQPVEKPKKKAAPKPKTK